MPPSPRPSSGGRNFQMQKRKTVKMHPAVGVTLFLVIPVVLIVVFFIALNARNEAAKKPPQVAEDPNDLFKDIRKKINKANILYQEAASLRDSDDQEMFKKKLGEAENFINDLLFKMDKILNPYRDEDDQLPDEFGGYSADRSQLQTWLNDIYKQKGFFD